MCPHTTIYIGAGGKARIYASSYYYTIKLGFFFLMKLGYMRPHTNILYTCPHTTMCIGAGGKARSSYYYTICVLVLLYYICVLILLDI